VLQPAIYAPLKYFSLGPEILAVGQGKFRYDRSVIQKKE